LLATVLEGGTIIDGTGRPPFATDIAFADGRIARIGDCSDREAAVRIDCRGRAIAPGFIDACSQTGNDRYELPALTSKVAQGVVLEVTAEQAGGGLAGAARVAAFASCADAPDPIRATTEACEAGAIGAAIDLARTTLDAAIATARAAAAGGAPRARVQLGPDGIADAVAIAREADVGVHVTHLTASTANARASLERTLEAIDAARASGLELACDVYPYKATWIALASLAPAGIAPSALADEAVAAAAAMEMTARLGDIWHELMLAEVGDERNLAWCGMRFDEIARQMRLSGARAVLRLLAQEGDAARAFHFSIHEDDVATALSANFCSVGSDAPAFDPRIERSGLVHPRAFGTFARIFGRFVRGRRVLSLEEAVRRMSALPAQAFGMGAYGEIAPERCATVVVFDPQRFVDTATYERPESLPLGLDHLFIDGRAVVGGPRR
jgi:N-acyl-D-amino-acid deacylase